MEVKNVDTDIDEPKMKRKRKDPLNVEEIQQFDSTDCENSAKFTEKMHKTLSEKTISSSSGLTLPIELLWEMTKCIGFEGLRQCCQTNFQLNALTKQAAMKTRQKLDNQYLGDIRLLNEWFQCWMVKSQEISTELTQQSSLVLHIWKNTSSQKQYRNQMHRIVSLAGEFCQSMDQLGDKMTKVIEAESKNPSSSGLFRLSSDCQKSFKERRCSLVERTFLIQKTLLQCWLDEYVYKWEMMFQSFDPSMATDLQQEWEMYTQEMVRCIIRIDRCQKLMNHCTDRLICPKIEK